EGRNEAACRAALAALTAGCADGANVLALAVEAARHDATLGEISSAMEEVFGRHDATPAPVSGVYASAYEFDRRWAQVTDGVEA
ncbi:methylmalonyl-CoA mutase family protein, partial [Klebsiella pneumoniae]|nr:methylmalonyl-CoA mutase family protein [Klebsiella pneumoniae]